MKQQVDSLTAHYQGDAGQQLEALLDRVVVTYCKRTLNLLKDLLNNHPTTPESGKAALALALKEFLKQNWVLVNGTPLTPTAMPETPIVSLLCDIAEYVAENQGPSETPLIPLQYLMPTVNIESLADDYPDFTAKTSLRNTLKTHILGQQGLYLIPIKLLQTLDTSVEHDTTEKRPQLNNYYYNYETHPEEVGYLNNDEYQRLLVHSSLTQLLQDAKQEYDLLANTDNHLLGQLRQLCQQLGFNSASGVGSEKNAGSGTYSAIINFMEYYNQLSEEEKNKIPEELKKEIDTLHTLATNKDEREDGTLGTDRCIATRRTQLIQHMQGHDALLSTISLGKAKTESLINHAKERFERTKDELQKALADHSYSNGQDKLGLTRALLDNLQVPFTIASRTDLDALNALSVNELTGFLKEPQLRQQIVQQIDNLENLVIFIMGVSPEKLKALLIGILEELMPLIARPNDLSALLMTLDTEKLHILCEAIKEKLPDFIKSAADFALMLRHLSPEQCTTIYEAMKDTLPKMIKSASDFSNVLAYLSPNQCTAICEAIKDKLPAIIKSGNDLAQALAHLSQDQYTAVCEAMKDKLPEIIKSGLGFAQALWYLSPEQRTAVYEAMKNKLPKIIKSGFDFAQALWYLSTEQRMAVYEAMKDKLPEIIISGLDFAQALWHLSPEQRTAVYEAMKNKLPKIIKSIYDFSNVLACLSPDQRAAVCEAIKDKLPEIIKSGLDFGDALKPLSQEKRTIIFEVMKDKLPKIITSADDLRNALEHLSPEQCEAICEAMKDKLPKIIISDDEFYKLLKGLSPTQCIAVCKNMTDLWPAFIETSSTKFIHLERRATMGRAIMKHYPNSLVAEEAIQTMANSADYLTMTKQKDFCRAILQIDFIHKQIILSLITAPEKLYKAATHAPIYLKSCFDALKIFHDKPNRSARDKQVLLRSLDNAKDMYCEKVLSKDRSGLSKAVRLLLMTVTNFIAALTFGIAHYIHYRTTGEVVFFGVTHSAWKLNASHRALNKEDIDPLSMVKNDDLDANTLNTFNPTPA